MSLVATRYRPMPGLVATSKQVAILTFGSENFQSSQRKGAGGQIRRSATESLTDLKMETV